MEFQILLQSVNKQKSVIEKTFCKFAFQILIFDEPRQFLARMLKSRYENPGNSGNFQKSPTSRSRNFFFTEPISIIFDFLKSSMSETSISALSVTAESG